MNLGASLYVVCQKLYLFMNSPTHKLGNRQKRERERERDTSFTKKKTIATHGHLKMLISRSEKEK